MHLKVARCCYQVPRLTSGAVERTWVFLMLFLFCIKSPTLSRTKLNKGHQKKTPKRTRGLTDLWFFCKNSFIKWLRDWRLKIFSISMGYRQTWILVVNWRWFVGKNSLKWRKFFWSRKFMSWKIVLGCFNNSNTKFWKVWTNGTHFMG